MQEKDPLHQKRRRDYESTAGPMASTSGAAHQPRNVAGSKRAEQYQQATLSPDASAFAAAGFDFALPVHSDELGRLPGATDFDFSGMSSQGPWPPMGDPAFATGQQSYGASVPVGGGQQGSGMDLDLEAIFSDLLPVSSYEDAFAALTQTAPQYPNPWFARPGPPPGPAQQQQHGSFHPGPPIGGAAAPFAEGQPPMWDAGPGGLSCVLPVVFVLGCFISDPRLSLDGILVDISLMSPVCHQMVGSLLDSDTCDT